MDMVKNDNVVGACSANRQTVYGSYARLFESNEAPCWPRDLKHREGHEYREAMISRCDIYVLLYTAAELHLRVRIHGAKNLRSISQV